MEPPRKRRLLPDDRADNRRVIRVLHFAGPADAARRLAFHGVPPSAIDAIVADLRPILVSIPRRAGDIAGLAAVLSRAAVPCGEGERALFLSVSSPDRLRELEAVSGAPRDLLESAVRAVDRSVRDAFSVDCRGRILELAGGIPRMMGVLNVTPDSFSDGGMFVDSEKAVLRGLEMAAEGADIVDVGGESTRPGSRGVSANEEMKRVIPVIRELAKRAGSLISVDTTKAVVAREAAAAGAHIVNDTSALRDDPDMAAVVRDTGCAVVLMHRKGIPETMQEAPFYGSLMDEIVESLSESLAAAENAGIPGDRIFVDPGIGFGKRLEDNLALHRRLADLKTLGMPIVFGSSRKSFLGRITGKGPGDRLVASAVSAAWAGAAGAHVLRVHDVRETKDAVSVISAIAKGKEC